MTLLLWLGKDVAERDYMRSDAQGKKPFLMSGEGVA